MPETKITADRISTTVEFEFSELSLGDGTAALPALAFESDQDSGLFRQGSNDIRISSGGVGVVKWTPAGQESFLQHFFADGSAALPSIAFGGDTDTGFYRVNPNQILVSTNGGLKWSFDSTGTFSGQVAGSTILLPDGSATTPSYAFTGNSDLGIYRATSNAIGFATQGTLRMQLIGGTLRGATGLAIENGTGAPTAPSYSFVAEPGLGWYRGGSARMSLAAGTVEAAYFDVPSGVFSLKNNYNMQTNVGTAAVPGYSFNGDPDSGMYNHGANAVGISAAGTLQFLVESGQVSCEANKFFIRNGSAATPSLAFGSDQDTGMYGTGTNGIVFSTGATDRFAIGTATSRFYTNLNIADGENAGSPGIRFASDDDTGILRLGANLVGFSAGATEIFRYGTGSPGGIEIRGSNVIYNVDGSTSVPSYTFAADSDTGVMRSASNTMAMVAGSTIAGDFRATGQSDGVRYTPFQLYGAQAFGGGSPATMQFAMQSTASVSTTPVEIFGTEYGLLIVTGVTGGGSAIFSDLILMHYGTTGTIIGSRNSNSPAARTYTLTSGDRLSLAMASGTYNIMCSFWRCPIR